MVTFTPYEAMPRGSVGTVTREPTEWVRERGRLSEDLGRRRERFGEIVRTEDRRMRMLAYRLLGDADETDDTLQEAYLKAYRAFPTFRDDAAITTWLYRIVYNVCLDRLRERERAARHHGAVDSLERLAEVGAEVSRGADLAETATRRDALEAALASLPVEQRAAVLLVDAIGYDYGTAAAILGTREGTIASRLNSARERLRRTLADRSEGGIR